jgi:anthranilate phosphoribosyltransferase
LDAREALGIVVTGRSLTRREAEAAMTSVMAGEATAAQLGALLAALHVRGETPAEIAGFASAMRAQAVRVSVADGAIDVVGTGGDRSRRSRRSSRPARVAASRSTGIAQRRAPVGAPMSSRRSA